MIETACCPAEHQSSEILSCKQRLCSAICSNSEWMGALEMSNMPPFVPSGIGGMHLLAALRSQHVSTTPDKEKRARLHAMNKKRVMMATSKSNVLNAQLKAGHVEVNIAAMSREDVLDFVLKLIDVASTIHKLKLSSIPKGSPHLLYAMSELQDPFAIEEADDAPPYHSDAHMLGSRISSAHVQHQNVRAKLHTALKNILLANKITDLHIGMRLTLNGYAAISSVLPECTSLRRLSFAGSHMGDEAVEALKDGLGGSWSVQELDLTACACTDTAMHSLAAVIRAHSVRHVNAVFSSMLRQYPAGHAIQKSARQQIDDKIVEEAGGLLHLKLAENVKITDAGAVILKTALAPDERMLLLSFRGCGLSKASESEFMALMKEHTTLRCIDLRHCTGHGAKHMGILKAKNKGDLPIQGGQKLNRKQRSVRAFSPTMTMKSVCLTDLLRSSADSPTRGNHHAGKLSLRLSSSCRSIPSPISRPYSPILPTKLTRSLSPLRHSLLNSTLSFGAEPPSPKLGTPFAGTEVTSVKPALCPPVLSKTLKVKKCKTHKLMKTKNSRGNHRAGTNCSKDETVIPGSLQANVEKEAHSFEPYVGDCHNTEGAVHNTLYPEPSSSLRSTRPHKPVCKKRSHATRSLAPTPAKPRTVARSTRKSALRAQDQSGPAKTRGMADSNPAADSKVMSQAHAAEITELAGMLRHLELEISKAEYKCQLARQRQLDKHRSSPYSIITGIVQPKSALYAEKTEPSMSPCNQQTSQHMLRWEGQSVPSSDAANNLVVNAPVCDERMRQQLMHWCDICDEALQGVTC